MHSARCWPMCERRLKLRFETMEEAVAYAKEAATSIAIDEARRRGALGELRVDVQTQAQTTTDKSGTEVELSNTITATAAGRV